MSWLPVDFIQVRDQHKTSFKTMAMNNIDGSDGMGDLTYNTKLSKQPIA
jgi:hypothetical protein